MAAIAGLALVNRFAGRNAAGTLPGHSKLFLGQSCELPDASRYGCRPPVRRSDSDHQIPSSRQPARARATARAANRRTAAGENNAWLGQFRHLMILQSIPINTGSTSKARSGPITLLASRLVCHSGRTKQTVARSRQTGLSGNSNDLLLSRADRDGREGGHPSLHRTHVSNLKRL